MKKILITCSSSGFGFQALNHAVRAIRVDGHATMGWADWNCPGA